jgi:hypothetical protein
MTNYLTLPEVLAVHADQIARYGGRPETYAFIADLYPTNGFSFEVLLPWLRAAVASR